VREQVEKGKQGFEKKKPGRGDFGSKDQEGGRGMLGRISGTAGEMANAEK